MKTFLSFLVVILLATVIVSAYKEVDVIVAVQLVISTGVEYVVAFFGTIGTWIADAKGVQ